ncbi:splicing factor 3a protein, putative [Eimeria tenella]|uniref:Splicing factor 3a protein, putative n=1 Tax=Eimeria tenella TaxID=5802 RepID=U6L1X8_EIMTE|nr:splicing factor 3a protein, putative [Eimeria tenella]CDJ43198.1 splicing factor 3a protein, putative [Eimeria tenella]|eukprot:XP_013233948.1 splicing factor 3a protein, putative [Eimeria tenella]
MDKNGKKLIKSCKDFTSPETESLSLLRLRKKGASEEQLQQRALLLEETKETGDYLGFLRGLGDFSKIPRHLKYKQKDFKDFLQETAEYLQDFFFRLNPLADQNKVLESFEKDFDSLFSRRQFVGWQEPTRSSSLYCPVSDKLFATPSTFQHYQQGSGYKKKLLQAAERSAAAAEAAAKASEEEDRQIAFLEFRIKTLADMLREQINQTIAYHQKKQSTNAEEALEEDEQDSTDEEEAAAPEEESEAEEDEGPVYNPLNLPLGFDGRPIPYWLYKLHGLGQEFKCEICGNFSYWGRRAFERHFAEWRHSFGMRCLKIPNTTHFKEITKIEDAILLYEKLKQQAEGHAFKQDQELECEDADGNVMSLRAFEDLRRQGLL